MAIVKEESNVAAWSRLRRAYERWSESECILNVPGQELLFLVDGIDMLA